MSVTPDTTSRSRKPYFCFLTAKSWTIVLRLALLLLASGCVLWQLAEMWRGNSVLMPAVSAALMTLTGLYFVVRGKRRLAWPAVRAWIAPCAALVLVLSLTLSAWHAVQYEKRL
jgi:hypothetical protein